MTIELVPSENQPVIVYHADFYDALQDLEEVGDEAFENDYPFIADSLIQRARQILERMYNATPQRFEVYPINDGSIIIQASRCKNSVLVVIEEDGGVACFVSINGQERRARYSDEKDMRDWFLEQGLADLGLSSD